MCAYTFQKISKTSISQNIAFVFYKIITSKWQIGAGGRAYTSERSEWGIFTNFVMLFLWPHMHYLLPLYSIK